jgi:hypothetical protein
VNANLRAIDRFARREANAVPGAMESKLGTLDPFVLLTRLGLNEVCSIGREQ